MPGIETERAAEIRRELLRNTIKLLARKWAIDVLWQLSAEPLRHNELRRRMTGEITDKALTRALRGLEEAGIVRREVIDTAPPGVLYQITDFGASLLSALQLIDPIAAGSGPAIRPEPAGVPGIRID